MAINFDKALGVHEQALYLHQRRNEVLAANIANADTPGYKAQDIDFRAAMAMNSASASGASGSLALAKTNALHIDEGGMSAVDSVDGALKYRVPNQPSLDGNTVESHVEQAAFADNSVRYQTTLAFLGSRFSGIKNVLQGGR